VFNSFKFKFFGIVIVIVLSLVVLIPTFYDKLPYWWPNFLSQKIRMGLDLQGGIHLVLEVDVEKAIASNVLRASQELEYKIRKEKEKILFSKPEIDTDSSIILIFFNIDKNTIGNFVQRTMPDFEIKSLQTLTDGQVRIVLKLYDKIVWRIKEQVIRQALEIIRTRIDQFGVVEPEILPQTGGRILVQLPGIKDRQRAIAVIGRMAQLEFKLVEDKINLHSGNKIILPLGTELNYIYYRERSTGLTKKEPVVVQSQASMTGEVIVDARVHINHQNAESYVSVFLNSFGKSQFANLTSRNIKKRLAVVLDGKIQSAPIIQEAIIGGEACISGNFTMEEAHDLAVVLRSGALPAPVKILEERVVGPSLGHDSISQGILAAIVGALAVLIFMVSYYKLAGVAADLAVIFNVIIILAFMTIIQITLTLPGIAGIILTIGMAVDANVIINERIREELRIGKSILAAVETGYARAMLTIFDANLTTVIVALVLYLFGTGPVKGFAVTLIIGLISSMFTAIVVTRVMFDYVLNKCCPKALSI